MISTVREAEARAMVMLFESWKRACEAQTEALARAETRLDEHERGLTAQEVYGELRDDRQDASAAAQAASIESHLRGLVAQALAGYDVSISVPGGVRVAGISAGTSPAEISAIAAFARSADDEVRDDARHSALWALENGHIPHPADVASLLARIDRDPSWRGELEHLAARLDAFDARSPASGVLVRLAGERMKVVDEVRALLADYGPARVLQLVVDPSALSSDLERRAPLRPDEVRAMRLDAILDGLFHQP